MKKEKLIQALKVAGSNGILPDNLQKILKCTNRSGVHVLIHSARKELKKTNETISTINGRYYFKGIGETPQNLLTLKTNMANKEDSSIVKELKKECEEMPQEFVKDYLIMKAKATFYTESADALIRAFKTVNQVKGVLA